MLLNATFNRVAFMCLKPLYLNKTLATGEIRSFVVPCGVCPECLKKRQSAIVVRSFIESVRRPSLCMFTLTYNDEHLPVTDDGEVTLRREDIKNWKKEFRKLISNRDFSWILSGEYSPRGFHRPHYHGIIFGLGLSDLKIIEDCWSKKYGFTVFKYVPAASHKDVGNVSRYISKYVIKDEAFRKTSLEVESPRVMTSVGFGEPDERFWRWCLCQDEFVYDINEPETITQEILFKVFDRLYFPIDGYRYSIPDYAIRKKLYYKNSSGMVCKTALLQMVHFIKKFRNSRVLYQELQQFHSQHPERTYYQNLVEFSHLQELSNSEKFDTQRENLISTYKKSVI